MSSAPRSVHSDHDTGAKTAGIEAGRNTIDDRTRRAATEALVVVQEAPDLFTVYSGTDRYTVDARDHPICSCHDFQYRSETITHCKHGARVFLTRGDIDIPFELDVDPTLVQQWTLYQTRGPAGLGYGGDS